MDFEEKPQFNDHYEFVDKHIQQHFDEARIDVFHEIPTLDIHLDVYHIKPENAAFDVLITSGMSSMAMNVSNIRENSHLYQFAELMTLIPKGIDFGSNYPSGSRYDWIISMLKASAKFPHFYNAWVGVGHTIQAHEKLEPYSSDTNYCGCIVLPTMTFSKDFQKFKTSNGIINIYSLFPLYKEELEFKIQNGYNEFMQFLIKHNASEIMDFDRTNYFKNDLKVVDKIKRWFK
jgi:hypothetical protein